MKSPIRYEGVLITNDDGLTTVSVHILFYFVGHRTVW